MHPDAEEQVASVTANIDVPESGARGVIITQGGSVGGWTLYVHGGRLKYCYNFFGIEHYMIAADAPIPTGRHQVRMEFAYDGGGLAKGGDVTLYYDGTPVGTDRVERTQPMGYSCGEACDVGADTGSRPRIGSTSRWRINESRCHVARSPSLRRAWSVRAHSHMPQSLW